MALKKTQHIRNVAITDAYCRLDAVRFDQPDRVWVLIGVYEDADHAESGDRATTTIEKKYTVTNDFSGNKGYVTMTRIYNRVKAEAEFVDAEDI